MAQAPSWTSTLAPVNSEPSEIRKGLFDLLDKITRVVDFFDNGQNIYEIITQSPDWIDYDRIIYGDNATGATAVTDANDAMKVGDYVVNSPFTNTPTNIFALLHTMSNTVATRMGQIGVPTGSVANLSFRTFDGSWSSWRPIASIISGLIHSNALAAGGVFNALNSFIPNTNDSISINGGYYNATHSFVISRAIRTSSTNIQFNVVRSDRTLQQINVTAATVHTGEGWSISW